MKPLVVIDITYMVYPETVINFSKLQRTHTNLLTTKRDSQEDNRALLESNEIEKKTKCRLELLMNIRSP